MEVSGVARGGDLAGDVQRPAKVDPGGQSGHQPGDRGGPDERSGGRRGDRPTRELPREDDGEDGDSDEGPNGERHTERGDARGEDQRERNTPGRTGAQPATVEHHEGARREDHRQGRDLLDGAEQLVGVDERGHHRRERRQQRPS